MNTHTRLLRLGGAALLAMAAPLAAVTIVDLGTLPPPPSLGGYMMVPAVPDVRPLGDLVTDAPLTGVSGVEFDSELEHLAIGAGWDTWSHGYDGHVYFLYAADSLGITVPAEVKAFYLYLESDFMDEPLTFNLTSGNAFLEVEIDGNGGARGFGFYVAPDESIPLIGIIDTTGMEMGFAVGEFGHGSVVPFPDSGAVGPLLLVGLAMLLLARRTRGIRG